MGKRVQFLDPVTNDVLCPAPLTPPVIPNTPPTPSSTFSRSSLPSFGPLTPPSTTFDLYPTRVIRPGIRVHPAFVCDDQTTPLSIDIARSPAILLPQISPSSDGSLGGFLPHTKYVKSAPFVFEPSVLDQPATYPPLPSLILISDLLPWSVHVDASGTSSIPTVTIHDVLSTLYITLHIPITPCEWASLSPTTQSLISFAFYRRIDSIADHKLREMQRRKGARRIDFLIGKTRLVGLRPMAGKQGVFVVDWRSI